MESRSKPHYLHALPWVQPLNSWRRNPGAVGKLKGFLKGLPGKFEDAVSRAFGASKAPVREFLDSFAERFTWNKSLTKIGLKAGNAQPRRRLRGKQTVVPSRADPSNPRVEPARRVPIFFRRARAATRRKYKMHKAAIELVKSATFAH